MRFELYGISKELLEELSYESKLGKSLQNTLRKFEKQDIINEFLDIKEFYESTELLRNVGFSYRIKAIQSCILKYNKYYPSTEVNLLKYKLILKKIENLTTGYIYTCISTRKIII